MTTARKKADMMKIGVDSLTARAAKMTRDRQALKHELSKAKMCIDKDDFYYDTSG